MHFCLHLERNSRVTHCVFVGSRTTVFLTTVVHKSENIFYVQYVNSVWQMGFHVIKHQRHDVSILLQYAMII